jgi:hypothetical protein
MIENRGGEPAAVRHARRLYEQIFGKKKESTFWNTRKPSRIKK